ncbi:MAG TPA: Arc family DNA-binding protein [Candidatus Krumholzibacteria bacterium]|nr:Arc family DNA-binding protein [Candidatus Krumholzibacteria bacterium]
MADRKSFLIRLPAEVLDELNRWAKDDLRSLNGQIEFLLRDALRKRRGKDLRPPGDEKPA